MSLAIGPGQTVWGLYTWQGIHEPSSASLALSNDGGSSFTITTLDTKKVLPTSFLSETGATPVLMDASGRIWRHSGGLPDWENWRQVVPSPPSEYGADIGLLVEGGVYVADFQTVFRWHEEDASWSEFPLHRVHAFARAQSKCWAATNSGNLYTSECDQNQWQQVPLANEIGGARGLSSIGPNLYLLPTSGSYVLQLSDPSRTQSMIRLPARTRKLREDHTGNMLAIGRGIHVLRDGHWTTLWTH